MSDPLDVLWDLADIKDAVISGDDVLVWPPQWLDYLSRTSLMQPIQSATCVPCDACESGHVETVILIESPQDTPIRAYIPCPAEGRVRVPLERLQQWRVDFEALARAVVGALSLGGPVQQVVAERIWLLGKATFAGQSLEIFMGRGLTWIDAAQIVAGARRFLSSRNQIVLAVGDVPPSTLWGNAAPIVVPLRILLSSAADGVAIDRSHIEGQLRGKRKAEPSTQLVPFPTPAGATWEQVEMRFKDGHTVAVKVLGEQGVFNYAQMGMANRTNAEPTVQWDLLKRFAESKGEMTWRSPGADRKNQKRRENLAKDFRAFFRIDGDPITLTEDGRGWRVRFELHDER